MNFFTFRKVLSIIIFSVLPIALIVSLFFIWSTLYKKDLKEMYIPKIIHFRIEDRYVRNNALIEVMQGTKVFISCDIVPDKKGYFFKFIFGEKILKEKDCRYEYEINAPSGLVLPIEVQYFGHNGEIIDSRKAQLSVIPYKERFFIWTLEDAKGNVLKDQNVPMEVKVYGYLYLSSKINVNDLKVIYFVEEYTEGAPVLQVIVDKESQRNEEVKFSVIFSKLLKIRRFGHDLNAYAFFTPSLLQIGNVNDDRKVFTIYAVLVKEKDIGKILEKSLSYEGVSSEERVKFKTLFLSIDDVQKISFNSYISEGFNVVRSPSGVKGGAVEVIYK